LLTASVMQAYFSNTLAPLLEYTGDHVAGWLSILDTAETPFAEHTIRWLKAVLVSRRRSWRILHATLPRCSCWFILMLLPHFCFCFFLYSFQRLPAETPWTINFHTSGCCYPKWTFLSYTTAAICRHPHRALRAQHNLWIAASSVGSVMSGFGGDVDENCSLMGYYTASSGSFLPTFRPHIQGSPLTTWPIGCPETSVKN